MCIRDRYMGNPKNKRRAVSDMDRTLSDASDSQLEDPIAIEQAKEDRRKFNIPILKEILWETIAMYIVLIGSSSGLTVILRDRIKSTDFFLSLMAVPMIMCLIIQLRGFQLLSDRKLHTNPSGLCLLIPAVILTTVIYSILALHFKLIHVCFFLGNFALMAALTLIVLYLNLAPKGRLLGIVCGFLLPSIYVPIGYHWLVNKKCEESERIPPYLLTLHFFAGCANVLICLGFKDLKPTRHHVRERKHNLLAMFTTSFSWIIFLFFWHLYVTRKQIAQASHICVDSVHRGSIFVLHVFMFAQIHQLF
eukprot:TRINITY_DN2307_c0_g1_i1.p1 TRINITY_DN2307_c0_g1~~TRINITY_DN2307_c0_g1_i1.p1  ORF type:complete len:326 (+),score=45.60 TRINITY_DN2307_c0_g1_i1:61-978(+)